MSGFIGVVHFAESISPRTFGLIARGLGSDQGLLYPP